MFRPGFIFQLSPRPEPSNGAEESPRLGLIASRKVGPAPVRNLVKRRIRELFRHHWQQLPARSDLVVILRPRARELSFTDLKHDFLFCINHLKPKWK